ncbi:tryptophan synthase subunit alpha [Guyparkeria sp. SCN-R1]|uniref:tryptophan synthase subunit alpha n=1 Tax=Guyparkeria sp. SCN-R1 TaxID=2341113 RepID=UPI001863A87B|nr:tryptophan synthase subunit alpha [Guyparkeria sp. SCN-R1]
MSETTKQPASRLASLFERLKGENRAALIPYITAGDPDAQATVELMYAMVEGGADAIEIGVPFSDPMADGPVIQAAHERALKSGLGLRGVIDLVAEFRQRDAETPVVLMGYQNPIEAMGVAAFVDKAASAGVDGVLTVDLPPEEADEMSAAMGERGMAPIFLLAPTTSAARTREVASKGSGFVYYVSLKGVTGAANLDTDALAAQVKGVREACALPVGVGFGIRDAETAGQVGRVADAVIVGSAIVRLIHEQASAAGGMNAQGLETVRAFLAELRSAVESARQ